MEFDEDEYINTHMIWAKRWLSDDKLAHALYCTME